MRDRKIVRNLVRVRTPWCSADVMVPYFTAPLARRLVALNTGSCPSGVTFNSASFWREMKAARPGWVTQRLGRVANLPWGRVPDAVAFYPPPPR